MGASKKMHGRTFKNDYCWPFRLRFVAYGAIGDLLLGSHTFRFFPPFVVWRKSSDKVSCSLTVCV